MARSHRDTNDEITEVDNTVLLELLVQRNNLESRIQVSVCVDNIQLDPVLSDFPSLAQVGILCARFRVPAAEELAIRDRGSEHSVSVYSLSLLRSAGRIMH
jgi:hypothetical protein